MTTPRCLTALLCCLSVCLLDPSATTAQDEQAITVEPISLKITRALKGVDENEDISRFHGQVGTEVKLLIQTKGEKGLIALDSDESELASFTDDKGSDLLKQAGGFGFRQGFSWFRSASDGKAATVTINASNSPAKGATQLNVKGKLVLTVATEKETHEQKGVALANKTTFTAGPLTGEIQNVGAPDPDWSDNQMQLDLVFKQDLTALADITFMDAAGKPISAERTSTSTIGGFGRTTTTYSYEFKRKVNSATVVLSMWKDAETIEVPVDMTVDVGL